MQVVDLVERIPAGYQPFDEVVDQLRRQRAAEDYESQTKGLVERLKEEYIVVVHPERIPAILAGLNIRLGAYGDPAAVPFHVWQTLLEHANPATGYTHQWRVCDSRFARYCMASADSVAEAAEAQALGYRTFRVGSKAESIVQGAEALCPASAEAGKRTTCAACNLCGGDRVKAKSIFIPVHGSQGHVNAFEKRIA